MSLLLHLVEAINGECIRVRRALPLYEQICPRMPEAKLIVLEALDEGEKAMRSNDEKRMVKALVELRRIPDERQRRAGRRKLD